MLHRAAAGGKHVARHGPATPGGPRPPDRRWKAQEGGYCGLHAQAAHHPQRHAPGPVSTERDEPHTQSNFCLTVKTVATPTPHY